MEQLKITSLGTLSLRFQKQFDFQFILYLRNSIPKPNTRKCEVILNCQPISEETWANFILFFHVFYLLMRFLQGS